MLQRTDRPSPPSLPSHPTWRKKKRRKKSHPLPSFPTNVSSGFSEANWWRLWWDLKQKCWQEVSSQLCRFGAGRRHCHWVSGLWGKTASFPPPHQAPLVLSQLENTIWGQRGCWNQRVKGLSTYRENLIGNQRKAARCQVAWVRACASENWKEREDREQTLMESFKSTLRAIRFLSIRDGQKREEGSVA